MNEKRVLQSELLKELKKLQSDQIIVVPIVLSKISDTIYQVYQYTIFWR